MISWGQRFKQEIQGSGVPTRSLGDGPTQRSWKNITYTDIAYLCKISMFPLKKILKINRSIAPRNCVSRDCGQIVSSHSLLEDFESNQHPQAITNLDGHHARGLITNITAKISWLGRIEPRLFSQQWSADLACISGVDCGTWRPYAPRRVGHSRVKGIDHWTKTMILFETHLVLTTRPEYGCELL